MSYKEVPQRTFNQMSFKDSSHDMFFNFTLSIYKSSMKKIMSKKTHKAVDDKKRLCTNITKCGYMLT